MYTCVYFEGVLLIVFFSVLSRRYVRVARAGVHRLTRIRGVDPFVVVFGVHRVRQSLVCFASSLISLLTSLHTAPASYFPWLMMALTRCSACRRFVGRDIPWHVLRAAGPFTALPVPRRGWAMFLRIRRTLYPFTAIRVPYIGHL